MGEESPLPDTVFAPNGCSPLLCHREADPMISWPVLDLQQRADAVDTIGTTERAARNRF